MAAAGQGLQNDLLIDPFETARSLCSASLFVLWSSACSPLIHFQESSGYGMLHDGRSMWHARMFQRWRKPFDSNLQLQTLTGNRLSHPIPPSQSLRSPFVTRLNDFYDCESWKASW